MMQRIAVVASVLTFTAAVSVAGGVAAWQPDTEWLEVARAISETRGKASAEDWLDQMVERELARVRSSDVLIVGTVLRIEAYERTQQWDIWTRWTVRVERALKGTCGDSLVVFEACGGTVEERSVAISGDDRSDVLREGERYYLCLRCQNSDPTTLLGGDDSHVYHIERGIVVRKGVSEDDFGDAISRLVADRDPRRVFASSDAVVQGFVASVDFSAKLPPDPSAQQRGTNHLILDTEQAAKGPFSGGESLRIELPYAAGSAPDTPSFSTGEEVVVFLTQAGDGCWTLAHGTDSRMRVRADGSLGCYGSLQELAVSACAE